MNDEDFFKYNDYLRIKAKTNLILQYRVVFLFQMIL